MPDNKDSFEGDQCRIKVNPSGGYFYLNDSDDISQIRLLDIAKSLSRQCRFTGHLLPNVEMYSVAEHCVLVSTILEMQGEDPVTVFAGLMHDTAEAYLSDIAAPFKGNIGNYHAVEAAIMKRIKTRYRLPEKNSPAIKKADWLALFIEADQLVVRKSDPEGVETWQGYDQYGLEGRRLSDRMTLQCWLPSEAAHQFLMRFAICVDNLYGAE